jgi:recombination protein RecR
MVETPATGPLQRLIDELKKLPGVGPRSAERIAFYLLKAEKDEAFALAEAVRDIKEKIRPCSRCYNLADNDLCSICADPRRDQSQIVVVEQPKDLITLESTGLIHGVYHVLMGHIAPLEGIEPDDLTIAALTERCRSADVKEVVLATNPNVEGDTTALHISSLLQGMDVKVTRLARGLAPGGQIEYANRSMLEEALRGRREV